MRVIPKGRSIYLVLTALLAFHLTCGVYAYAQTASSTARFFQMALWFYESQPGSMRPASTDTDVQMFSEGNAQPAGRSIMQFKSWNLATYDETLEYLQKTDENDWSGILAAVIDEPYWTGDGNPLNPCEGTSARLQRMLEIERRIKNAAKALNTVSPKTRLWINFSQYEAGWIMDEAGNAGCPLQLNGEYIDVVSVDHYETDFVNVQPFYEWIISSMPQQQLALIPGTYFRANDPLGPVGAKSLLQDYFDYANSNNQSCNLNEGRVGVTGSFDSCRVWIVAGWMAGNTVENGIEYIGELDPRSGPITEAWREQLAHPLSHQLHKLNVAQRGLIDFVARD